MGTRDCSVVLRGNGQLSNNGRALNVLIDTALCPEAPCTLNCGRPSCNLTSNSLSSVFEWAGESGDTSFQHFRIRLPGECGFAELEKLKDWILLGFTNKSEEYSSRLQV